MNESLRNSFQQLLAYCRESRKLVLLIVAIGLLLDNMLLTSVGMDSNSSVVVLW